MSADGRSDDLHLGMEIPLFEEGKIRPNSGSAGDMNLHARLLRSFANAKVSPPQAGEAKLSDQNFTIDLSPLANAVGLNGGKGGNGSFSTFVLIDDLAVDGGAFMLPDAVPALPFNVALGAPTSTDWVYVALPFELRQSEHAVDQIPGLGAVNYAYAGGDTQWRTATWSGGAVAEDQYITPPFLGGELVVALYGTTGIVVNGTAVNYQMFTCRSWATP